MKYVERRFTARHELRVRPSRSSDSPGTLEGYAAVFSQPGRSDPETLSSDLGGWRERIAQRCFDRSLRNGDDVIALFNHSADYPLGRVSNKTLRLSQDSTGLRCEIDLSDTSYSRDLFSLVRDGTVSEMSFAFQCEAEDWSEECDPEDRSQRIRVRTVRSAKLLDTSVVTRAAYPAARVSAVDPVVFGRSHSFDEYFPDGNIPSEVRSRVGSDFRQLLERSAERRRRLTNSVLSV